MSFSLWMYWWIRGHPTEGERWAQQALAGPDPLSPSGRATLLFTAAFMLVAQGQYPQAATRLDQAERLAREAQDSQTLCWILTMRGYAAAVFQDTSAAATLTQAEALSRAVANPHATSRAVIGTALVALSAGHLPTTGDAGPAAAWATPSPSGAGDRG